MSNIDDGGSAFPGENDESKMYNWVHRGMSLRDYFAGQAIVGLLHGAVRTSPKKHYDSIDAISEVAYAYADAMIAARKAGGT